MKTEVLINIFTAIEPNIKTNGLNRVLMYAMHNEPINKVIEVLTDNTPIINVPDYDVLFKYAKENFEYNERKVIRVDNARVDYLDNTIKVKVVKKKPRYYNDSGTDYMYNKSDEYPNLKYIEDYDIETIDASSLNSFLDNQGIVANVDSTKSPVEES